MALQIDVHTHSRVDIIICVKWLTWLYNLHGFILKVQTYQ